MQADTAAFQSHPGGSPNVQKVARQLLELVRDYLDTVDLAKITIAGDTGCAWYAYEGVLHPESLNGTETESELTGRAFDLAHALIDAQPKSRSPSGEARQ